ncbi:MAG: DEAD/DEAH box helicase, partial [Deltaproteobacteria bacterium]
MKEVFATIAVELPVDGLFTYRVPTELTALAGAGRRAVVPFGNRTVTGYILELTHAPLKHGLKGIKDIKDIIDDEPLFGEKSLKFLKWLASYYFSPLGPVLALTHPLSANVRSIRFLTLTDAGRLAADEFSGAERHVIEAARKGASLASLLKRFKGEPVYSMIARLKKKGLLSEETRLKKAKAALYEKYLSLKEPSIAALTALNEKSPMQARLYEYLMTNNHAPLSSAAKSLGCPVGQAASALEKKGILDISERLLIRDPLSAITPRGHVHEPNQEQAEAISAIKSALEKNVFSPFLLYGVTGSGKTLVYLKAIEEAIKAGKKVIFMVPEISLTPWPAAYLMALFPGRVALVHSGLSEGERLDTWKEVLNNKVDIAVGPRSALFSPLKGLGLIIVDEE